jgi:hypothetical protein
VTAVTETSLAGRYGVHTSRETMVSMTTMHWSSRGGPICTGRTRAQHVWAWTADKLPRHVHYQSRSLIKFLRLSAQRRAL